MILNKNKRKILLSGFEIMLNNKNTFSRGMCSWIGDLYRENKITKKQFHTLREYIKNNKSKSIPITQNYWWEIGNIKPRIKWINQQQEKLKNYSTISTFFTKLFGLDEIEKYD